MNNAPPNRGNFVVLQYYGIYLRSNGLQLSFGLNPSTGLESITENQYCAAMTLL